MHDTGDPFAIKDQQLKKTVCVCVCVCVCRLLYQRLMVTANQKSTVDTYTNKKKQSKYSTKDSYQTTKEQNK